MIFFKNNFFTNVISVNQIVNFKNNLSVLTINSYSNYRSVLCILNFVFLFIVFIQKIILFLNSAFLDIAHGLLDAFRVYFKSNDVFNKIYSIFGSDFGLKYYFNILWFRCLPNNTLKSLSRFDGISWNFDPAESDEKSILPYAHIYDTGADLDKIELRSRETFLLLLNNGFKQFLEDTEEVSYRRLPNINNRALPEDFFSLKHKKQFIGPYNLDSVYFFLTSSNLLLPHLLGTLASKTVWGVSGLVNYKNLLSKYIYTKILYSYSKKFYTLSFCFKKIRILSTRFVCSRCFFLSFSFNRGFYKIAFRGFFNAFKFLSGLYSVPAHATMYYGGFKNNLSLHCTNVSLFLKNLPLLHISGGLFAFRFFSMRNFFGFKGNKGIFFYKFNLILKYFGPSFYNFLNDSFYAFANGRHLAGFFNFRGIFFDSLKSGRILDGLDFYYSNTALLLTQQRETAFDLHDNSYFSVCRKLLIGFTLETTTETERVELKIKDRSLPECYFLRTPFPIPGSAPYKHYIYTEFDRISVLLNRKRREFYLVTSLPKRRVRRNLRSFFRKPFKRFFLKKKSLLMRPNYFSRN